MDKESKAQTIIELEEEMPNQADIRLKIHANEQAVADLCRKYWLVSHSPNFQYSVEELADSYGMDVKAIHKVVGQNSTATGAGVKCAVCNKAVVYRNRTTYKQLKSYLLSDWVCRDCFDKKH